MRHRSNIAFILLAAALFAAPQVSHDLSSLKGAVAAGIRGRILQAFLGLHASESGNGAAIQTPARRTDATLASCSAPKSEPQSAQKKNVERTATARRAEARAQTAMLVDPAEKSYSGLPPALARVELASLPREILTEARLAMLTPPGTSVEPPITFAYRGALDPRAKAAAQDKFVEIERHAAFVQAHFERNAENAEWLRRVSADAARSLEDGAKAKTRVIKVRRQGRACGGGNVAPCAPLAPAAAPVASDTGPSVTVQVSTIGE